MGKKFTWTDPTNGKANHIEVLYTDGSGDPDTQYGANVNMGVQELAVADEETDLPEGRKFAARGVNTDTDPDTPGPLSNVYTVPAEGDTGVAVSLLTEPRYFQRSITPVSAIGAFTFEAWIRTTNANGHIAAFQEDYATDSGTGRYVSFRVNDSRLMITHRPQQGSTNRVRWSTIATVNTGAWVHVAGSMDTAETKLYINGVPVEADGSGGIVEDVPAPGKIWVARRNEWGYDTPDTYLGDLADIRFWNIVRTDAQIGAAWQSRLVGNETGLVWYYKIDEGSGDTLNDSGPSAYHLAAAGAGTHDWVTDGPL